MEDCFRQAVHKYGAPAVTFCEYVPRNIFAVELLRNAVFENRFFEAVLHAWELLVPVEFGMDDVTRL